MIRCFCLRSFYVALCLFLHTPLLAWSWGFFAHQQINRYAVTTLPPGMFAFYKTQVPFLTEKAINPDKRRYVVPNEAEKHFIDLEAYFALVLGNEKKTLYQAIAMYGQKMISEHGALPWAVVQVQNQLTQAFRDKDVVRIRQLSADLGHYIADAHVPLHTTQNYNGQLSGQEGIHALWETQLPLLFFDTYDLLVGQADYIEDPLEHIWSIVLKSHALAAEALRIEAQLSKTYPAVFKYSFEQEGVKKNYSVDYATAYHSALKGQVENQLRESILQVGRFWVTAWVNAGSPDLTDLLQNTPPLLDQDEPTETAPLLKNIRSCGT